MSWTPEPDSALLIVDVQNDFLPGGALGVPEGHAVIPPLNALAEQFAAAGRPVIASRDWHPAVTTHFQPQGGPWPPHCVQGTPGAAFAEALRLPPGALIVSKGMGPDEDAYSAFQARDEQGRPLAELLRERGVRHLYVGGLATDYCVQASALDALAHGFRVTVLEDAVRAVDLQPGDGARALEKLRAAGATIRPAVGVGG
ncbi:MAG: nicotinamidase [Chloroflexi bacterium]|nr:nicotinamidase [Chloroflexota bacterium]